MDTYPVAPGGTLMVSPPSWNREPDDEATKPTYCRVGRHSAPAEEVRKAPCGGTICDECDNDTHLNGCKPCQVEARAQGVYTCPQCGWLLHTSHGFTAHIRGKHVPAQRAPEPEGYSAVCAACGMRCADADLAPTYECATYEEGLLCPSCHNAHTAGCRDCRLAEYSYAEPDREAAY